MVTEEREKARGGNCARPLNKRSAAQRFEWFSQSNFHFEPAPSQPDDGGVCIFSQPRAEQTLGKRVLETVFYFMIGKYRKIIQLNIDPL